jgi:hypothetical protein
MSDLMLYSLASEWFINECLLGEWFVNEWFVNQWPASKACVTAANQWILLRIVRVIYIYLGEKTREYIAG